MLEVFYRKKRKITKLEEKDGGIYLESERGIIRVIPIKNDVVRVSYTESERGFEGNQATQYKGQSESCKWTYESDEINNTVTIKVSDKLSVIVSLETGSISYVNSNGNLLLEEAKKESKIVEPFDSYATLEDENAIIEEIKTADGVKRRINAAKKEFVKVLYHTKLSFDFDKDEVIFGLGQSPEGVWNLRGTTQYLHQANLKSPIPIFLSSKKYGVMSTTKSACIFDDTQYGSYLYTHADEYLDYYFIAGDPKDVVAAMRYLSGKASILPKWAYGYIQSQERYESQKEILDTINKFEELQFPVSAIVLDWLSWPDNLWGQKSLDPERFPDPVAMTEELHKKDKHLIVSIWPNMGKGGSNYDEFKSKGLFLPNAEFYNPFVEEGRKVYWRQVNDGIFSKGADGWWGDNCEPCTPEWERPQRMDAGSAYRDFVEAASKIMHDEDINTYCINHGRAIYEGQRKEDCSKRVINVTRCGYPGGQSMGTVIWSGDISASWDTLRRQITAGIQYCSTGMPYWHTDIGAFFVKRGEQWYWNGDYDKTLDDPDYIELYLRWFQYGAFMPIMRGHGTDCRREPWNIAEPGSKEYNILLDATRVRYKLMPYIYSLAGAAYLNDESIMKPLCYDFPNDRECMNIEKQYMYGPSFMICPVIKSKKEATTQTVYLPEGKGWYDFYTNEKYEGGQYVEVTLKDEYIPVFVPEGAIIPMDDAGKVTLNVYAGKDGRFNIYTDAGDGYGYEDGDYLLTEVAYEDKESKITTSTFGKDIFKIDIADINIIR